MNMTKLLTKKGTLMMFSALVLAGCAAKEEDTEQVSMSVDEQIEWTEEFNQQTLQGQAVFSDVATTFIDNYDALDADQKAQALHTFVLSIENQSQKLSNVIAVYSHELYALMETYPDVNFETGENREQLPDGVIRGLYADMEKTYTRLINQSNGQIVVGIDFDRLMDNYKEDMSSQTLNRLSLVRFEQEHSFLDFERGHLDFEAIWKGLDLIDRLNKEFEDMVEQNEYTRYFYYRALLGYEDITMENEDGSLNEAAIEAMEALIEKHQNSERSKDLKRLVAAIKEEGVYGEKSHQVADDILTERFKELTEEMEDDRRAFEEAASEEMTESDNAN